MLTPNRPGVKKYTDRLCWRPLTYISTYSAQQEPHPHLKHSLTTSLATHPIASRVAALSTISDHDGPNACINVRVNRFQPRNKLIRDEKRFDGTAFKKELSSVLFKVVYSVDDPNEKLVKTF